MSQRKQEAVQEVVRLVDEYPIVGLLNMENLPAKNLAQMRKQLRDKVTIYMTKKRLLRRAFKEAKKDVKQLEQYMKGMPALLLTKDNPFSLFKTIKKNQSPAPIKAGQEAPADLIVPPGPTEFTPGPIIGELGQMGIKSAVEEGKIVIKQEALIAKEGDIVDNKQAGFLAKMGIEPMRIGLSLVAVWENGEVLDAKVLDIDEEKFMADVQGAALAARTLSIELGYPTRDTIDLLLQKAHMNAQTLTREAHILTSDNVGDVLASAHNAAVGLSQSLPEDAMKSEKKEEPAEEKKEETPAEKKEEPAAEEPKEAPAEKKEDNDPTKE